MKYESKEEQWCCSSVVNNNKELQYWHSPQTIVRYPLIIFTVQGISMYGIKYRRKPKCH